MNTVFFLSTTVSFLFFSFSDIYAIDQQDFASEVKVKGDQKKRHKLTLEITGPASSEQGRVNTFLDYQLDMTFRQGSKQYSVAGYYAADGQAGESSASSGNDLTITFAIADKNGTDIPATPIQLKALPDANTINLSWKDEASNEDGFEIERKEADGSYTLIHVTKANTISYADDTPKKGKEYYYRVRAVNTFGKSGYSNEIKTTLEEPINNLPTATFTFDNKSGFLPLKVEFDATDAYDVDGKIVAYNWNFGDGNKGTGEATTHTFETEGVYKVQLTVIDDHNGKSTITKKIIVLSTEEIQGTIYYVSSSEGNDNNQGTAVDQPWKTLQKVNDAQLSPGDTIFFKRGDIWSENLIIPASGVANGYIYFAAYGQGDRPVFAPVNAAEAIGIEGKSYISVSDIHVMAEAYEKGIRIAGDAAYVIINSCLVEGHSSSTSTRGIEYSALSNGEYPTYPTITDCEVHNFQEGIGGYAGLHGGGNISENYVHTTATGGTDLIRAISGDYEGLIISNNELSGWKDDAIDLYGGSNIIIEHNHIYSPATVLSENGSGTGIKAGGVGPPQSNGNIIRYNKIHHLSGTAGAVYDGINTNNSSNGKIYGNLIYAVQGNAIAITSGHDYWRIYHNTAISAEKSGINVGDNVKNIELINNIIGGKTYDIEVSGADAVVSGYYNLLINRQGQENSVGGVGIYQSVTDINRAETDSALFDSEEKEDFRLAESGAAIDAGMTLESYNHDIQGESIQHLPDIGAYEYQEEEIIELEPPYNLQANEIADEKIELTWADVNQEVRFVIERVTVSETDFIAIDTTSAKNYIDTDVQYGIKYFYRVKAIHSFIASEYSNIAIIKLEDHANPQNNLPPVASFTTNVNEGKAPLEVSLDASESTDQDGDIISFHWDFGDGNIGSGKQITHVFAGAGEYTISLTVTDDQDSIDKVSQVITVILPENQLPMADAGEDQTIAYPINELKLNGGGTDPDGEVVSYLWEQLRGPKQATIIDPAAPTTQISELIVGEYLFQLTVTDDRGGSATDDVSVLVEGEVRENQLPVAFAGEDRVATLPVDTLILTGKGIDHDGTIATYQWSYEGTDNLQLDGENESAVIVSGLTVGVHLFRFTVIDNDGGSTNDEVEIIVKGSLDLIRANKAFSPNGDGIDDVWIIENIEAIEECKLTIFNRAGQQVFEATPYHNNWDATRNGQPLPSTDYYYIIQCSSEKIRSGGIRVLR